MYNFESSAEFDMAELEKDQIVPDGFVLVRKEMSWQKADEIASEYWMRYQRSHEIQQQGQNATSTSIELARHTWCKNKAHQIKQDYKATVDMMCEKSSV